jgi:hypothetical protein
LVDFWHGLRGKVRHASHHTAGFQAIVNWRTFPRSSMRNSWKRMS